MNMSYLLAFDVGTTRVKAVLATAEGRLIATSANGYPIYYPRHGWAEQSPEDWWRAVGEAGRELVEKSGISAGQILGLAFSTQMLNVICLDEQSCPLGRSISWIDGRAGAEAGRLMRRLGGPKIFATLLGATLTAKDFLPKYFWLKRHAPELYRRTVSFTDASGYLLHCATGRTVCEWTHASVTGLFNLKSKTWDRMLMRFLGVDAAKFPGLVQSSERVGGLTAAAAAHLGLLEGTPVFGGAGDAMTAAVGSGAVGEGDGHLCLGTSGFIGIVTRRRLTGRRGMATVQSADPGKLLMIGETETAAACLKWAAKELYAMDENDPASYQRMDGDVDQTAPGSDGLFFTPWMYGERAPVSDETVRAGFINLGSNHTRAQMTRAIYEGVAYNLRWVLDSMDELYRFRPDPLRVIGGGARGRPWLQIIADVTGRTLESVAHPQEAGAIGAGLLAAVGLGVYPSVEAVKSRLQPDFVARPNPALLPVYDPLYDAFRETYRSLRGLYRRLNRLKTTGE